MAANQLAAVVVLAMAALLVLGELGPKASVRRVWPIVIGAGLIAARLAILPAGPAALQIPPDGDGPWTLVVESHSTQPRGGAQCGCTDSPNAIPRWKYYADSDRGNYRYKW